MKKFLWFIVIVLFLPAVPASAIRDRERSAVYAVLDYGEARLNSDWRVFHVIETENWTRVAWTDDQLAVVDITMVKNEDAPRETAGNYDAAYFDILLENYQPYTFTGRCETDTLQLYTFTASYSQLMYMSHYWMMPYDEAHFFGVNIVFPENRRSDLEQLSTRFFSELPACPES